jgi:signal transduction histidine kinase
VISSSDILHGKVLIVDDQEVNVLLLEQMLRSAGYVSITSTMDPGEVCKLHVKNRYDLILLDLQMPGMDGFQVMEGLKEIEPDGYLPVLVITAQPGHKLRALQAGAKDFISKPFELAEVLARVHNMLEVRLLHKELHNYNDLLEERVHEQAMLLAISHTLASTLELQPGLILDQLREIIEYTHGGLFALEDSTLVTLAMRGTQLLEQSAPIHMHLNTPESLAILFNGHLPIRIADVWSEDPQAQFLRSLLDDGSSVLLEGMQSWMWVPLAVKGRLIGGVGVAETTKNYFTEHHADLGLSVAHQAAITMVNTELYGQTQALAVLEERQRLARNLHDAVNQSLFSAGLIAEVLPRLWERDQEEARRSLEELHRLTRGAMAEMRALLAELRPSTLTDSDLGDLLRLLGNALSGRTNLPVAVTVTGEFTLPAEVQIAFYRVCQEALNNVAKHAKASQVAIDLKQERAAIELRIRDDGQGFDTKQKFSGHYGLSMMRERAEAAGLLFSVTSQPGQGTELTIRWINFPPRSPYDNLPLPTHSRYAR